jgi:hypothetical protein
MTQDRYWRVTQTQEDLASLRHECCRDYLARLDMPPVSCRRRVDRYENWLGLALFLPPYLFVLWKVFTG